MGAPVAGSGPESSQRGVALGGKASGNAYRSSLVVWERAPEGVGDMLASLELLGLVGTQGDG